MKVILIRHGATRGNLEGRYIGCRTDEPLCREGIDHLAKLICPAADMVFISPMLRCRQTAAILYPGLLPQVVPDFRECDFGEFEGKNYPELCKDPRYQAWIDSNGTRPFPGGESRAEFAARSLSAFRSILPSPGKNTAAIIAHGGTVMSIMEAYARPPRDYFYYQVKTGTGFILNPEDGTFEPLPSRR